VDSLGVVVAMGSRYQRPPLCHAQALPTRRRSRHANILAPVSIDTPQALAKAFVAAVSNGEVEAAVALWSEDAAIVQPDGQTVRGRRAIARALQTLVDQGVSMEIEIANVFATGDVATVVGTLTLNGSNGSGEPFAERSSSVVVYTRGPDGWRIALDAPWGLPAP
jgi:uncharacterized protein (TIGR02246 family)